MFLIKRIIHILWIIDEIVVHKEQLAKASCSSQGMERYNHVTYIIDKTVIFNQITIKV